MYVLRHKKNKVYLKYFKKEKYRHYVRDINEATKFDERGELKKILKKFKYPENWEIVKINFKSKK